MKYATAFFLFVLLYACSNVQTPIDYHAINDKALAEINNGDYDKAISYFHEILNENNVISKELKVTVCRNLAQAYMDLSLKDSALFYSTIAYQSSPKNSYNYYVNLADKQLMEGKVDKAVSSLKSAYALNKNDLSVNNTLGLIFIGEYDTLYSNYELALVFNKKAYEIVANRNTETVLALNYYLLNKYDEADYFYTKLSKQFPNNINYLITLANIKEAKEDYEGAEKIWLQLEDEGYYD